MSTGDPCYRDPAAVIDELNDRLHECQESRQECLESRVDDMAMIQQLTLELAEARAALQDVKRTFDVTSEGHCGEPWREFKFWCERHADALKAAEVKT